MFRLSNSQESGFVLPYVLLISFLITSLLLGIIGIIFFYNKIDLIKLNKKKLDLACTSAVQKFLSEQTTEDFESKNYLIDSIDVLVQKKQKGLYWELEATAKKNNDSSKIKDQFASKMKDPFDNALIFSKPELKAAVTGNTKINGDILTTDDKITIGRIQGIPTPDNDYHNGEIKINKNIQAKFINEQFASNVFYQNAAQDFSRGNDVESFELNESTVNKALSLKEINVNGDLVVEGNLSSNIKTNGIKFYVTGQTIIKENTTSNIDLAIISDSTIDVNLGCSLENIILSAESKINIFPNCHFKNSQLFSKKDITINSSQFNYPSIVMLYIDASKQTNFNNLIDIKSSIINGSVLLLSSVTGLSANKSKIKLDESSKLQGLVYSENNVDLEGKISGIVYTYSFWYYKEPTEYINWLVNFNVDRHTLDTNFLLPVGFKNSSSLKILKETWIY